MNLDPSDIRKQGWIYKESAMLRQYRKRWLVLTPERLYTFKKERDFTAPTEVREGHRLGGGWTQMGVPREGSTHAVLRANVPQEVDLRQCGTVKSADDMTNRPFSFTGAMRLHERENHRVTHRSCASAGSPSAGAQLLPRGVERCGAQRVGCGANPAGD